MDDDFDDFFTTVTTNDIDTNVITQESQSTSTSIDTHRKRKIQHLDNRKY